MMTLALTFQQQAVPRTQAELDALEARRDALSEQFQAVTHRRGMLAQERLNAEARVAAGGNQDKTIVKELEQQVAELGQRSVRIQRELAGTEDAIATARARGVGEQSEEAAPLIPAIPPMPAMRGLMSMPPRGGDEAFLKMKYQRMMLVEALAFVLLGAVAARFLWRAALRRASHATPVAGMSQMQQALDVIAVEVERISENQRYVTKMLADQSPGEKVNVGGREGDKKR